MNWWRIARLSLTLFLKDRLAFFWLVGMPLVFAYVFGMAFRSTGPESTWIPVADYDGGRIAQIIIEQLSRPGFSVTLLSPDQRDNFRARPRTLVIPPGFTRRVLAKDQSNLYLVHGRTGDDPVADLSVKVNLFEVLGRLLPGMVRVQFHDKLACGLDAWDDLQEELERGLPVKLEVRSASSVSVPPSGFSHTSVGYLVLFVLINTVVYGGSILAAERRGGQLRRQAVTPIRRADILVGMLAGRWVLAVLQTVLLIAATGALFGIDWGRNPLGLALVAGSFAFACASLGIFTGSRVSTPEQAILLGIVGGNAMGALGGCWWPIELMPDKLKTISYLFPTAWATHGLHEVVSWGRGTESILGETLVLLAFGLVFLVMGAHALRYD